MTPIDIQLVAMPVPVALRCAYQDGSVDVFARTIPPADRAGVMRNVERHLLAGGIAAVVFGMSDGSSLRVKKRPPASDRAPLFRLNAPVGGPSV